MKLNTLNYKKIALTLIIAFQIIILFYISIRAYILSFTHDESLSYMVIGEIKNTILPTSTNNHILNTIFMKLFDVIFGAKEFALRLQSVLSYILYSVFSYLLLRKIKNIAIIFLGFMLLTLNPFILDFFSLARGYGLALAFSLGSMYFLIKSASEENAINYLKSVIYSLLLSILAMYSNFYAISIFCSLIVCFTIQYFFIKRNIFKEKLSYHKFLNIILLSIYLIIPAIIIILKFNKEGQLYLGGENGLIKDTLTSLIECTYYFSKYNHNLLIIIRIFCVLIFFSGLIYVLFNLIFRKKFTKLFFISLLTSLMILIPFMENILFGILYPMDRVAILYIPFFCLYLIFFLDEIYNDLLKNNLVKNCITIISILICIPVITNFSNSINFKYTYLWKYDSNTKNMINKIISLKKNQLNDNEHINISTDWLFEPTVNFYKNTKNLYWFEKTTRQGTDVYSDYYYQLINEKNEIKDLKLNTIQIYNDTKTILKKNSNKYEELHIKPSLLNTFVKLEENIEYLNLYDNASIDINSKEIKKVKVYLKVNYPIKLNLKAKLVFSLVLNGKTEIWDSAEIDEYVNNTNKWFIVNKTFLINRNISKDNKILIFLWNFEKKCFYIKDCQIKFLL